MTDLKMDMAKIQTLVGNAFSATGALWRSRTAV